MNVDSGCGCPNFRYLIVLSAVVVSCDWCGFAAVPSSGVCWAGDSETVCWRVLVLCGILLGVRGFCCDQWVTLVNLVCPQVSGLHASAGSCVWSWVLEMSARGNRLNEQRIRVWLVMMAAASIPIVWHIMGRVLWALSLRCEVDHSPPCNIEVKNAWSYTSFSPYILMLSCLVKQRDNITFTWS